MFQDIQATTKPRFIVDDSEDYMIDVEDDSNDDDENLFDSVCAFCDNGGELLWYAFVLAKFPMKVKIILLFCEEFHLDIWFKYLLFSNTVVKGDA